jgi:HEAT repeat protein
MQEKLHDPRALIELGASETAGAFLGPGGFGVTVIEELAKDKSSGPRAIAAKMLGHDNSEESREAIELALSEKSWVVRASAAEAMGRQGSPRDIDKLAPLLDDTRPEVRYSAAAAIVRLAPRPLETAAPKSQAGDTPPAAPLNR